MQVSFSIGLLRQSNSASACAKPGRRPGSPRAPPDRPGAKIPTLHGAVTVALTLGACILTYNRGQDHGRSSRSNGAMLMGVFVVYQAFLAIRPLAA